MVAVHHILPVPALLAGGLLLGACSGRPAAPTPPPAAAPAAIALDPPGAPAPGTPLRSRDPGQNGSGKGMAVVPMPPDGVPRARPASLDDPLRPVAAGDAVEPAPPPAAPSAAELSAAGDEGGMAGRLAEAEDRIVLLEAAVADRDQALAAMEAELRGLRQAPIGPPAAGPASPLAGELARLEAERSYFALAAQVLRLAHTPAAVDALQESVRTTLAARADLAPEGGHAP